MGAFFLAKVTIWTNVDGVYNVNFRKMYTLFDKVELPLGFAIILNLKNFDKLGRTPNFWSKSTKVLTLIS
jgi:hypothetical protein